MQQNQTPEGKKAFKSGKELFMSLEKAVPDEVKTMLRQMIRDDSKIIRSWYFYDGNLVLGYQAMLGRVIVGCTGLSRKAAMIEAANFIEEAEKLLK